MQDTVIWVLVADEKNATICASHDGVSELVASYQAKQRYGCAHLANGEKVVQLADAREIHPNKEFAGMLMSALREGAYSHSYEGVVIIATEEVMKELRLAKSPIISELLIAEIMESKSKSFPMPGRETFENRSAARSAIQ